MLNSKKYDTSKIKLAKIRYFDVEHNGAEVTDFDAYAILYLAGEKYVNLFDFSEEFPVFERSPYPNVTKAGHEYGNKIIQLQGELTDGPCYIFERTDISSYFPNKNVSLNEIESYVLRSPYFFPDRISIIKGLPSTKKINHFSRLASDVKKLYEFESYMNSHEKGVQYKKRQSA